MKQIRTFFLGENLVMFDLQDVGKLNTSNIKKGWLKNISQPFILI